MTLSERPSSTSSRTARALGALFIACGVFYSCVERPDEVAPPDPNRRATLESAATCAMTNLDEFEEAAQGLQEATAAWAESPDDEEVLADAQDAWKEAMSTWHILESMTFGPAGSSDAVDQGGAVGGQDLRDVIYSWPVINSCRIDQALVSEAYEGDLSAEPVNAQGLDAIEYLLFYTAQESTCLATTAIIADGEWDAIDDLSQRRASYAEAAATLVHTHAQSLVDAWSEDGGNFQSALVEAGESGPFEDQNSAINAVTDAIFHVELTVKDQKLGIPLAINPECTVEACPEKIEHQFSGLSKEAIASNVAGFEQLFRGCGQDALGLEGLLREEGAGMLADNINAALDGISEALDAIEEDDLVAALAEDPESVNDLYAAVKVLTDLLKNDLVGVLQVSLPGSVDGDSD